ncbi:MAG: dockerin type I repeat-containing protein, partial [Bacilli bacterium]
DEIIGNMGVAYNNNFIWGLNTNMSFSTLESSVKNVNSSASLSVTNSAGITKNGGTIATGDNIALSINSDTKTYTAVIYGDVSGDGSITVLDLLKIQKHILGSSSFASSSSYYTAADVSKDGNITVLDLLKVQKHILGSSEIAQS